MTVSRYHRQTILPGFGPEAEAKLAASHVMVVGLGALGCPAADLLARAGVGTLSLVDRDLVELTNLQRQTLYGERDVGKPKAEAAAARLRDANTSIRVHAIVEDFSPAGAEALVATHPRPHVVLDCTDNFQTRYLINDACVKHGLPLVYGGAVGTEGVQFTIRPGATPCLRCLFPDAPAPGAAPTCDTAGIFAPVSVIIGATQAADAIKLIIAPEQLGRSMLRFDLWAGKRSRLDLTDAKDPQCRCCGKKQFDYISMTVEPSILCGRNSVQLPPLSPHRVDLTAVAARLAQHGTFQMNGSPPSTLSGTLSDGTPLTLFRDGRAIVGNTTDFATARSIYARYIGA